MRRLDALRRVGLAVAACALTLVAVGCGSSEPIIGGKPNPKPVRLVASLSPSTSELVGAYAFNVNLVGKSESCDWPQVTKQAQVVMKGVKPNYEKLASMKPDLVVYDADLFSESDIAKIEQLGIRTLGFDADTVEDYIRDVYTLGSELGAETRFAEYVDGLRRTIQSAKESPKHPRVAVILTDPRGSHMVAGKQSFVADVVRVAGGTPVGPDAGLFVPVNVENLVSWNPEIIFCTGDVQHLYRDARLATLAAVKSGYIAPVNDSILLRRGARVDRLIEAMHKYVQRPVSTKGG